MIRDLFRLIVDIIVSVRRDVNRRDFYINEQRPKTYGTRIKR